MVLGPLLAWLVVGHLPRTLTRRGGRADWVDGIVTTAAMLVPLGLAALEIHRLRGILPAPTQIDLFSPGLPSGLPGGSCWRSPSSSGSLAGSWGGSSARIRSGASSARRWRPGRRSWRSPRSSAGSGTRPGGARPCRGWRTTTMLNTDREGALPDIQILYFGPDLQLQPPLAQRLGPDRDHRPRQHPRGGDRWAWSSRSATSGATASPSISWSTWSPCRPSGCSTTPAHDGVRLFLPTFFFLAAFAGWGAVWLADGLARLVRAPATLARALMAALVLVPAGWQLVKVHPFELSYYNELIGGPRGAWKAGFELAYWCDAFNDRTIAELNERLPRDATVEFLNDLDQTADLPGTPVARAPARRPRVRVDRPGSVPVRLAPDARLEGDALHAAALRDDALVRARAPAAGRPPGRDRGRPRGGLPGLGAATPGRSRRRPPAPPARRAGLGPSLRAVAGSVLGRRARALAAPEGQRGPARLGADRSATASARRRASSPGAGRSTSTATPSGSGRCWPHSTGRVCPAASSPSGSCPPGPRPWSRRSRS